jgi:hypothetical protein
MPGRSSRSTALRYVGIATALLALVGYTVLGWRFDGSGGTTPFAIGAAVAVFAVGWTLYQRLSSG